jgi:hypothetical protein
MSTGYKAPHNAVFSANYFIPLPSKYSPQYPVLKHPQSVLASIKEINFHNHTKARQNYRFLFWCILAFILLDNIGGDKRF